MTNSDGCGDDAGGHVLTLGSGSNILGLMASQMGARLVTCIERGPMLYRMAKMTLQSNRHIMGVDNIVLVDRQLQAVGIQGRTQVIYLLYLHVALVCA